MNELELITNAIGASGFTTDDTYAGQINPEVWNTQLNDFLQEKLVVADKARTYNDLLGSAGDTLNVTVRTDPITAGAVSETDDVSISVYTGGQVVFAPTEYAAAFQLSDKEARRSFYSIQSDMGQELGYSLAELRDSSAIALIDAGAGNTIVANNVVASDVTTSDTLDYDDLVNGMTAVRKDKLTPRWIIVSAGQAGDLMKSPQFVRADQSGDSLAFRGGLLGTILGMEVFWTTHITPTANQSKALMIGVDNGGNSSFGMALKSNPAIRTERHELGRYTDIVAVEEWDFQILRANGLCTIESYDA